MTEPIETTEYLWAVKITTEYLSYPDPTDESKPHVDETVTRIDQRTSEHVARSIVEDFEHAEAQRAAGNGYRHPRSRRISSMQLLRRPVGPWEVVR